MYKSLAQQKYFNDNREMLEKQGINVDEWNKASEGLELPEHVKNNKSKKKDRHKRL